MMANSFPLDNSESYFKMSTFDGQIQKLLWCCCCRRRIPRSIEPFKILEGRGMSSTGERYNLYSQGSSGWSTLRYEEFQEEDVWGVLRETKELINSTSSSNDLFNQSSTNIITSRRLSTASRMIPNSKNSSSIIEPHQIVQHSAPVNIPDWSKIYGKKSSYNNTSWVDHDDHGHDGVMMNGNWDIGVDENEEEEEEDDDGNMIPPHEWISRKLARSQISSFSVYEGVGRTLKGRDLSNVRNDILTKTGFLE